MSAVLPPLAVPVAGDAAGAPTASGAPAWRRLRKDRVGIVSLVVVLAFVLMIVLTAQRPGRRRAGRRRWACRARRRPSWARPRPVDGGADRDAERARRSTSRAVDPLAPRYKEWAERAAKYKTVEAPHALTLPFGARPARPRRARPRRSRERRSRSSSACSPPSSPPRSARCSARVAGFFGGRVGDLLEWVYNVFTVDSRHPADARRSRRSSAAASAASRSSWRWPAGPASTARCAPSSSSTRRATTCARPRRSARRPTLAHVPPHPAQRQPRHPGAHVAAGGRLHQGRGDPVVPRPGRRRRRRVLGHDARRGAERADPRLLVAARRRHRVHGRVRHRVLADDRRHARRARSRSCAASNERAAALDRRPARRLSPRQGRRRRAPRRGGPGRRASRCRSTRPSPWSANRARARASRRCRS